MGRWLSRDPLGEAGGINLYEYALSNPVNFVDPLGLSVLGHIGNVATTMMSLLQSGRMYSSEKSAIATASVFMLIVGSPNQAIALCSMPCA